MNTLFTNKNQCCGCSACMNICPTRAIKMQPDRAGFLYPEINHEKCIKCEKCVKVCDFKKPINKDLLSKKAYAGSHIDKNVIASSSSGGAFTLISDYVLNNNGLIYGCVLDNNFDVYHKKATDETQRNLMRGSKYVQSDMRWVYRNIAEQLKSNKIVLFVGTPCQVAGLYAFIGQRPENLVTVDLICHGVQSQSLLKDHIKFLEKKYNKKAVDYNFRDKVLGWRHVETVSFSDGVKKSNYDTFRLKHLFMLNIALRPACYKCKYSNYHRVSDITIGDFWGGEEVVGNYKNQGISVLLSNTRIGEEIIANINIKKMLKIVSLETTKQRALLSPAKKPLGTETFWEYYCSYGYAKTTEKYSAPKLMHIIRFTYVRAITVLKLDGFLTFIKSKYRNMRKKRLK